MFISILLWIKFMFLVAQPGTLLVLVSITLWLQIMGNWKTLGDFFFFWWCRFTEFSLIMFNMLCIHRQSGFLESLSWGGDIPFSSYRISNSNHDLYFSMVFWTLNENFAAESESWLTGRGRSYSWASSCSWTWRNQNVHVRIGDRGNIWKLFLCFGWNKVNHGLHRKSLLILGPGD